MTVEEIAPLLFNKPSLTPTTATVLFAVAVVSGYRYRRAWKSKSATWKKWVYGLAAGACLLLLGLLPMDVG